ncbi:MAG: FADH2 O2-dependent halogenase [Rhodothermales bacterium]
MTDRVTDVVPDRVDLLVVGGGFVGSVVSMIARRLGLSVAMVDRDVHPRFAIGESSTPAGNMVLASLGARYDLPVLSQMARYGTWKDAFPELGVGAKRGFSYFHHEPGIRWRQHPEHDTELLVAASDHPLNCDTHWYRPEVDAFLFREAGRMGASLFEGVEIDQLVRPDSWVATLSDGRRLASAVLLDATGGGGFASRFLQAGTGPPLRTQTRAAFAHFAGLPTWQSTSALDPGDYPFPADHAALHHVTPQGWMWQLRFDNDVTSVGIVTPVAAGARPECVDPDAWIGAFPGIAEQFRSATLTAPRAGWVRTGNLQRRCRVAGGLGWALLPHAAGFVDPLHSTGIAHSLAGIERLALLLEKGDEDFGEYGEGVLTEIDHIDGLVSLCYQASGRVEAFNDATMLYFAASIQYERARMAQGADFRGAFLGADDPEMARAFTGAAARLGHSDAAFREGVKAAIEPWNDAGLLAPEVSNMYRHTAPRGW